MTVRLTDEAVARVQDTLDYITEHPEEHRQTSYAWYDENLSKETGAVCGTAFCWAGHMVNRSDTLAIKWTPFEGTYSTVYEDDIVDRKTGETRVDLQNDYEAAVGELLGFPLETDDDGYVRIADPETRRKVYRITDGWNSLERLWEKANELCDGRLNVPEAYRG